MIRKSVERFSDKIMLRQCMIRKSVERFSDKIMLRQCMIRKSVERFSDKIMLRQCMIRKSVERFSDKIVPEQARGGLFGSDCLRQWPLPAAVAGHGAYRGPRLPIRRRRL